MRPFAVLCWAALSTTELCAGQGYTNKSEVPLYGQSPPVYPSRKSDIPIVPIKF